MEKMKELIAKLNEYTRLYDLGTPAISDKEWDELYFELVQMEKDTGIYYPDSPTQTVDYKVVSELSKIEHNHPMLSLEKTKDLNEIHKFVGNHDFILMPKMDGLTCSLRYMNGKLVSAETRGDGVVGEDILHNAKTIKNIPSHINYTDELIIDGEMICTYQDFDAFASDYQNPRNFAAGSIRLLDSAECAKRNLTFVAWEVIKGFDDLNNLHERLMAINKIGFTTVPWVLGDDWDAKEFMRDQATEFGYPIDGLVYKFNDIAYGRSLGATGHHLRNAMAFKFYDESTPTNLKYIEWTMGRTGALTPVAVFNAIDIDGTMVERASLHNINVMTELLGKPYVNQELHIFKANMIIPQVSESVKSENYDGECQFIDIPDTCPYCGQKVVSVTSPSGTINLICTNDQCSGKLINVLDHYCGKKGLDIKGLSTATLEKLISWGWVNEIADLYRLRKYRTDWYYKTGFGVDSVDKILKAIDDSVDVYEPWRIISAMGIPLIGSTASKALMKVYTVDEFVALAKDKFDFTILDDFGEESNNAIWSYNYDQLEVLLDKYLVIHEPVKVVTKDNPCNGKTFVITGSLIHYNNRDELKDIIESLGGKVAGSVSAKTHCLINNDATSTSSKNEKAKKLGIPILTEDEFIQNYIDK